MEKIGAFTDRTTDTGEWRPGNPATGQTATPMLSEYFNMLQRELVNVVEAAGIPLSARDDTQMLSALQALGLGGYASSADARALSSLTKLLSPRRLADAFRGSNQSLLGRGYQILPGGLIIQWGAVSVPQGQTQAFSLSISFPNAGLRAVANKGLSLGQRGELGTAVNRNQVIINNNTDGSNEQLCSWIALGH